jgi:tetratricopeptide (TPR) repeat protein
MRFGRRVGILITFLSTGCAADRQSLADLGVNISLSSLPSGAQVQQDGREVGVTPMDLHLDTEMAVTLTFALGGFTPRTITGTRDDLYKKWRGEVGVVLLPVGYNNGGPVPGMSDVDGLTGLAEELQKRGDWARAAEVWEHVLVFSPRNARAHRGMGSCLAKMGRDEEAIREYEQYLFLAPGAPDAARVQRAVDNYRGGIPASSSHAH